MGDRRGGSGDRGRPHFEDHTSQLFALLSCRKFGSDREVIVARAGREITVAATPDSIVAESPHQARRMLNSPWRKKDALPGRTAPKPTDPPRVSDRDGICHPGVRAPGSGRKSDLSRRGWEVFSNQPTRLGAEPARPRVGR